MSEKQSQSQKFDAKKYVINLKGKEYLPVAARLIWFREEKPLWGIETDMIVMNDTNAVAKATVKDESGRIIATATKTQNHSDFKFGHVEKAETGAIGRALALCGYGTQFTDDFDEGEHVVDSPGKPSKPVDTAGINFSEPKFPYGDTPTPAAPPPGFHLNMAEEFPDEPPSPQAGGSLGDYVVTFGKYKGKKLNQVGGKDLKNYVTYLENSTTKEKPMGHQAVALIKAVEEYCGK